MQGFTIIKIIMKTVIKFPIEITINTTRSAMEEEMRGFRELFDKFISEPGPSVEWENIQVLNREKLIMTIQLELEQEENKWYKNHDYTASLLKIMIKRPGAAPALNPVPLKAHSNELDKGCKGLKAQPTL